MGHLDTQGKLLLAAGIAIYLQLGAPRPFVIQPGVELREPQPRRTIPPAVYFPLAAAAVVSTIALIASISSSKWHLAYAMYGSLAAVFLVIPNALAYLSQIDVPFPTFSRTLGYLERRDARTAIVIRAGIGLLRPPSR